MYIRASSARWKSSAYASSFARGADESRFIAVLYLNAKFRASRRPAARDDGTLFTAFVIAHARLKGRRSPEVGLRALLQEVGVSTRNPAERRFDAEFLRRIDRPVRVVQQLSPERDKIRASGVYDVVRMVRMDDHADGHSHDIGAGADLTRIRH